MSESPACTVHNNGANNKMHNNGTVGVLSKWVVGFSHCSIFFYCFILLTPALHGTVSLDTTCCLFANSNGCVGMAGSSGDGGQAFDFGAIPKLAIHIVPCTRESDART